MMASEDASIPVWEAAKENVLPVKKGRSVKTLRESVVQSDDELRKIDEAEKQFRKRLLETEDPSSKILVYAEYVKWARVTFPHNSAKEKEVLEVSKLKAMNNMSQCVMLQKFSVEMKNEPSLRNDERYVGLWIEYVSLVL